MVASVNSPADVVNVALAKIGFKGRVGNLYEGSAVAKKVLDIFGQTRDELLRTADFNFARRDVGLTLLKAAPQGGYIPGVSDWDPLTNPPPPWAFSYQYPSDCLRVRAVKPVSIMLQQFDPNPYVFSVDNDNASPPAVKVILCNVAPPGILTYTGQITNPAEWDADFVEIVAAALGERLAPIFAANPLETAKLLAQVESQAGAEADSVQG